MHGEGGSEYTSGAFCNHAIQVSAAILSECSPGYKGTKTEYYGTVDRIIVPLLQVGPTSGTLLQLSKKQGVQSRDVGPEHLGSPPQRWF